ncbi:hypothetical protein D1872_328470 [compost metagenome]
MLKMSVPKKTIIPITITVRIIVNTVLEGVYWCTVMIPTNNSPRNQRAATVFSR